MFSSPRYSNPLCWRRLYTEASLYRSLADMQTDCPIDNARALSAISRLDKAIVIAGAAGEGRADIIHAVIAKIQSEHLPASFDGLPDSFPSASFTVTPVRSSSKSVHVLSSPPSMAAFQRQYSKAPFVLKGYINDWPATTDRPWRSPAYLCHVAGPGRVVPVEVGSDYRASDWTQTIMSWNEFLDKLCSPPDGTTQTVLYLAQHNLLAQFPSLRDDIIVPDYVYAAMPAPGHYLNYRPPGNEEQLVLNAWLGPAGTTSPAHTDPYYNMYAQVVGRKTVWLASPDATPSMYPYPSPTASSVATEKHNPAANHTDPSLSNTSRVDVFAQRESTAEFPKFWEEVVPQAMSVTLEPGDLLFFPPGWWHAMRSESVSFSVSMWF
ncbi:Clavaminate synthase-like protein [Neolentinus lepideus HHB14362 ss-1]|uniref:Clavaminate synthase-like protein n=1 Tax=Neolentinus lepideus HHB14362 ss-1 TaxID=1314782 RepID=A0A165UTJ9_9AGAM|nr:Clavaminate synthase-like protein [Neolentinus lepideus HHB14362 ss-1]